MTIGSDDITLYAIMFSSQCHMIIHASFFKVLFDSFTSPKDLNFLSSLELFVCFLKLITYNYFYILCQITTVSEDFVNLFLQHVVSAGSLIHGALFSPHLSVSQ